MTRKTAREIAVELCFAAAANGVETDELLDVGQDGVRTALHGGDGIALSLQAYTLSHDSAEFFNGYSCCTTGMHARKIAAEDEDLVVIEFPDVVGRDAVAEFAYLVEVFGRAMLHATVCLALVA